MEKKDPWLLAAAAVTAGIATWRYKFPWLADDIETIKRFKQGQMQSNRDIANKTMLIDKFESNVAAHPHKVFIIFEDKEYTYYFVDQMANKVANAILLMGLKIGDVVAIMMYNGPAFIWTFLGLQKLGLTTAFINYHLKAKPLTHSLRSCEAKAVIVGQGDELLESVTDIRDDLAVDIPFLILGKTQNELSNSYMSMDDIMLKVECIPVHSSARDAIQLTSPLCFIYTSGTTGLPKAAIINQGKAIGQYNGMLQIGFLPSDVLYVVTPLYHSAATCVGLFNVIGRGATIALARKFSAHAYWNDVRRYHATSLLYIGELCRYLLALPETPDDGHHNVRMAYGNGLRRDIWTAFKKRFKIPKIYEFFGATEGTSVLVNVCQTPGCIGRYSPLTRWYIRGRHGVSVHIVKFDPLTKALIRNKEGRCVSVGPGEEGIIISGIPPSHSQFYFRMKDQDEKKTIHNAFHDGDRYFNFGDIVYVDNNYNVYFRDRTGDTFRWKGENVSTIEVANIIGMMDCIQDVNVYGVQIPDTDGRAGMAAILLKEDHVTPSLLSEIYKHCHANLPGYACPIFLRFVKGMILTQTMKQRKLELVDEGIDIHKIQDPLFVSDKQHQTYIPIHKANYKTVIHSKL